MQYWYLFINNAQVGPLTLAEVQASSITPDTMVWNESLPQWTPAAQIPELTHLFTSGPAENAGTATPPPPPGNGQQHYYAPGGNYYTPGGNYYVSTSGKDKTVAGILAILLGGFGAQYFYLGKIGSGVISIILSFVTCGIWSILMLVQGILMLTMSQQEFDNKFVYTDSTLPLF